MKSRVYRLVLTLGALGMLSASPGFGQPLVVSNNQDSGDGSLPAAVGAANDGDTITFSNGFSGTITLGGGELSIGKSITIQGPGAQTVTVEGAGAYRVFEITGDATVTISGLTISNGLAFPVSGDARGGGILINQDCALTLSNCWVVGNTAQGAQGDVNTGGGSAFGGGISVAGLLTLVGCTISSNTASGGSGNIPGLGYGGGINLDSFATMTVNNCTVAANQTLGGSLAVDYPPINGGQALGGGIFLADATTMTLTHCTISGNSAIGGSASVSPSGNQGDAAGGGMDVDSFDTTTVVGDTIVAGNTVSSTDSETGPDIAGSVTSLGSNLIGNTRGNGGWVSRDLTGVDPGLGLLQFNGGQMPTMTPGPFSPAIDAGNSGGLTTDQRGEPRPIVVLGKQPPLGSDGSDIGAVEVQAPELEIERGLLNYIGSLTLRWRSEPGWHWHMIQRPGSSFGAGGSGAGGWVTSSLPVLTVNNTNRVVINSPTGSMFFRLTLGP